MYPTHMGRVHFKIPYYGFTHTLLGVLNRHELYMQAL